MGALVATGFLTILGIAFGIILSIIGLFVGNIILFDSLALAIVSGFLAHGLLNIHSALSIVIGIAMAVVLYGLQNTKVGFWIIGGLLSIIWGLLFADLIYEVSGRDEVWGYVVLGLGVVVMILLHLNARKRQEG